MTVRQGFTDICMGLRILKRVFVGGTDAFNAMIQSVAVQIRGI